jgi:hypothetical protein
MDIDKLIMRALRVKLILSIAALLMGVSAFALAWYWFGFRMALVLFLLNFAINIDQHLKR